MLVKFTIRPKPRLFATARLANARLHPLGDQVSDSEFTVLNLGRHTDSRSTHADLTQPSSLTPLLGQALLGWGSHSDKPAPERSRGLYRFSLGNSDARTGVFRDLRREATPQLSRFSRAARLEPMMHRRCSRKLWIRLEACSYLRKGKLSPLRETRRHEARLLARRGKQYVLLKNWDFNADPRKSKPISSVEGSAPNKSMQFATPARPSPRGLASFAAGAAA